MYTPPLLNAARAFAMVSFSDGNIDPTENKRFASAVKSDPYMKNETDGDIADAWVKAVKEVQAAQSFGGALLAIRSEMKGEPEKAMVMRIAQAAVVADKKIEVQEIGALRALADALGLDPMAY
jgi:tellurite resistance protein